MDGSRDGLVGTLLRPRQYKQVPSGTPTNVRFELNDHDLKRAWVSSMVAPVAQSRGGFRGVIVSQSGAGGTAEVLAEGSDSGRKRAAGLVEPLEQRVDLGYAEWNATTVATIRVRRENRSPFAHRHDRLIRIA